MRKKIFLGSVLAGLVVAVLFVLPLPDYSFGQASPTGTHKIKGCAWSSNVGYVCFSDPTDPSSNKIQAFFNYDTGKFSGYAWSSNIGWIKLNPPTDGAGITGAITNGSRVTGWMQAGAPINATAPSMPSNVTQAGGWDGKISMSDGASGTKYKVSLVRETSGGQTKDRFGGFAWGSLVVGYLNFCDETTQTNRKYCVEIESTPAGLTCTGDVENMTINWSAFNAGAPVSGTWSGDNNLSGTGSTITKTYTTTGEKNATVTVGSNSASCKATVPGGGSGGNWSCRVVTSSGSAQYTWEVINSNVTLSNYYCWWKQDRNGDGITDSQYGQLPGPAVRCSEQVPSNYHEGVTVDVYSDEARQNKVTGPLVCPLQPGPSQDYTLTVIKNPASGGMVASSPPGINCGTGTGCVHDYSSGTTVRLTATPVAGSVVQSWSSNCDTVSGNSNQCDVVMNSNKTVTVNFSAPSFYWGDPTCTRVFYPGKGQICRVLVDITSIGDATGNDTSSPVLSLPVRSDSGFSGNVTFNVSGLPMLSGVSSHPVGIFTPTSLNFSGTGNTQATQFYAKFIERPLNSSGANRYNNDYLLTIRGTHQPTGVTKDMYVLLRYYHPQQNPQ